MSLDVIQGESRNRVRAQALVSQLTPLVDQGTIYLGYPVLATADERVEIDALLVCQDHGLVAFLLSNTRPTSADQWDQVIAEQDQLYAVLESHLSRHQSLRKGRTLALRPMTATVFTAQAQFPITEQSEGFFGPLEDIPDWIEELHPIDEHLERHLQAALQRVTTIKPVKKRSSISRDSSRGAIMKKIEYETANLDSWQKAAAIESPEGPQRIRGLAGSGKTVVLALKAAYWHSQHPEWNIALTFHSQALYQQINDLVTRFTFEHISDAPDTNQLKILHSWGSRRRLGVYSMIADALGEPTRDWSYANGKYGRDNAFAGVCRELLDLAERMNAQPIFDAILIDEAQDLPPEFFQLVHHFTKHPKRIVWAYDELQKLSESTMLTTDELFGTGPHGENLISLASSTNEPRRDIILPVCYRNTPWALATAHALGIGIHRYDGLLQHPDEPQLWRDVGYNVVSGSLTHGSTVTLERSIDSYPQYFNELLEPHDSVVVKQFADQARQDAWVAKSIKTNLTKDELEYDDILVVLPDAYRAKSRAPNLMRQLRRANIDCHLVGVNTSADEVFLPDSIAITHIHRAKGNEAPMVYAVDSQYATGRFNSVTRRNSLFTAVTRSKAWVRIVGWGDDMAIIVDESNKIMENDFRLTFPIPTLDKLAELRHLYRDRPAEVEESLIKATKGLEAFLDAYDRGDLEILDLPPDLRTKLLLSLRLDPQNDDD